MQIFRIWGNNRKEMIMSADKYFNGNKSFSKNGEKKKKKRL